MKRAHADFFWTRISDCTLHFFAQQTASMLGREIYSTASLAIALAAEEVAYESQYGARKAVVKRRTAGPVKLAPLKPAAFQTPAPQKKFSSVISLDSPFSDASGSPRSQPDMERQRFFSAVATPMMNEVSGPVGDGRERAGRGGGAVGG